LEIGMRIGAVFPTHEIGSDPGAIRDIAQAAEEVGFDHLIAYDHVLGADPDSPSGQGATYTSDSVHHEPFVLFGYLAGLTERIELWTGILILPQRQTALVAKQAAEISVLSEDRLVLGVGVGWNATEYEGLGEDFRRRGAKMEEAIHLLRALWSQPTLSFEGHFHRLTTAGINPRPARPIPIWMGGEADAALDRIGRLADGWIMQPRLRADSSAITPYIERIHNAARAAGRDPGDISIEGRVSVNVDREAGALVARAREWEAVGCTHITLNTMGAGLADADAHIAAMRGFREAWSE
jgi:probable F420-dependent oxidoreductase